MRKIASTLFSFLLFGASQALAQVPTPVTPPFRLSDLGTQLSHTFLCNPTASTANLQACLFASYFNWAGSTLGINNFTGDSGAGGVAGLVPAPATGDAAAGKYLNANGTWVQPATGGTVTNVTLAPGFTTTVGTQNTGTNAITATGTINKQLYPVAKTTGPVTVAAGDTGNLLIANAASLTFNLPAPATGTRGRAFQIQSDGANSFTVSGGAANVTGCTGGIGTSLVVPKNFRIDVVDDGTLYRCSLAGIRTRAVTATWLAGQNLAAATHGIPLETAAEAWTIVSVTCRPEDLVGGVATIDVYVAPSATALASGTKMTSSSCNANAGVATNQTQTISSAAIPAGSTIGIVAIGAGWTNNVGNGGLTIAIQ